MDSSGRLVAVLLATVLMVAGNAMAQQTANGNTPRYRVDLAPMLDDIPARPSQTPQAKSPPPKPKPKAAAPRPVAAKPVAVRPAPAGKDRARLALADLKSVASCRRDVGRLINEFKSNALLVDGVGPQGAVVVKFANPPVVDGWTILGLYVDPMHFQPGYELHAFVQAPEAELRAIAAASSALPRSRQTLAFKKGALTLFNSDVQRRVMGVPLGTGREQIFTNTLPNDSTQISGLTLYANGVSEINCYNAGPVILGDGAQAAPVRAPAPVATSREMIGYGDTRPMVTPIRGCGPDEELLKHYCFGEIIGYLRAHPEIQKVTVIGFTAPVGVGTYVGRNDPVGAFFVDVQNNNGVFSARKYFRGTNRVRVPNGCMFEDALDEGYTINLDGALETKTFKCGAM